MSTHQIATAIQMLLQKAGIHVNGQNPWDIHIHNPQTYERVIKQHNLGLGETYMDGWWDCKNLDELFFRILHARLDEHVLQNYQLIRRALIAKIKNIRHLLFNRQTKRKAFEVCERHYDIGNDLYQCMLDSYMAYTCGYWRDAQTLEEAQRAKLDLVCRKLELKPGMRVLDIGCGWGSFAKYAAEHYDASVVGITLSKEQLKLAQERCAGLPIEIRFQDYRDVSETFDRVCSIGMFEAVGYKNYQTYMKVVHRCLKDDGLFLLHTIGNDVTMTKCDEWIDKYIFPNGMLPSMVQIAKAVEGLFVMEDWHNFGADYDKTLMAWHHNFNKNWDTLKQNYTERFRRMWNYYLLSCAGSFRSRVMQLWQIVLSKKGMHGGYLSVR